MKKSFQFIGLFWIVDSVMGMLVCDVKKTDRSICAENEKKLAKKNYISIMHGFASLAQLVERRPYKANVGGSTPSGRTRF